MNWGNIEGRPWVSVIRMFTFEKPTVWDVLPFDLLTNKLIKKRVIHRWEDLSKHRYGDKLVYIGSFFSLVQQINTGEPPSESFFCRFTVTLCPNSLLHTLTPSMIINNFSVFVLFKLTDHILCLRRPQKDVDCVSACLCLNCSGQSWWWVQVFKLMC